MITIKKLKDLLSKYPDDAKCYAYEGEDVGLNITYTDKTNSKKVFSFIPCCDKDVEE